MALGAFLAGLLLAETEFALQVESDIAPYRGLLLGLFFMTVKSLLYDRGRYLIFKSEVPVLYNDPAIDLPFVYLKGRSELLVLNRRMQEIGSYVFMSCLVASS